MGLGQKLLNRLEDFPTPRTIIENERRRWLEGVSGDVLEIGFGTGLNLPFLSRQVNEYVGLDPSPSNGSKTQMRLQSAKFPVMLVKAEAEHIPFEDQSFDFVLSTWTLCTVKNPEKALQEIHRVLKPMGQLVFIEHGKAEKVIVRAMQSVWAPVQKCLAEGCHINRPIRDLIIHAGFQAGEIEEGQLPGPRALTYTYRGIATKRRN